MNRKLRNLIIVAAIILIAGGVALMVNEINLRYHFSKGNDSYNCYDYDVAINEYEKCMNCYFLKGRDCPIRVNIGLSMLNKEDILDANMEDWDLDTYDKNIAVVEEVKTLLTEDNCARADGEGHDTAAQKLYDDLCNIQRDMEDEQEQKQQEQNDGNSSDDQNQSDGSGNSNDQNSSGDNNQNQNGSDNQNSDGSGNNGGQQQANNGSGQNGNDSSNGDGSDSNNGGDNSGDDQDGDGSDDGDSNGSDNNSNGSDNNSNGSDNNSNGSDNSDGDSNNSDGSSGQNGSSSSSPSLEDLYNQQSNEANKERYQDTQSTDYDWRYSGKCW